MNQTIFAEQAEQILWSLTKIWSMRTPLTSAEAADVLLQTAYKHGFLRNRERPLLGNTLSQWGSDRNAPRWALRSALVLLLEDGWLPSTHPEWAAFASLFIMSSKGEPLDAVLELLPTGMDKRIAAGWICAAVENAARYQEWKTKR